MKKKNRRRIIGEQFRWLVDRRLEGAENSLMNWALTEGLLKKSEALDTLISFAAGVNIIKRRKKRRGEHGEQVRRKK